MGSVICVTRPGGGWCVLKLSLMPRPGGGSGDETSCSSEFSVRTKLFV